MKFYRLLTLALFTSTTLNAEEINVEKKYEQGMQNIYLVKSSQHSKLELKKYGYSICGTKTFCSIWFFDDAAKAESGITTMKSGSSWDIISGLIGIYSKNKKVNDLICYDEKGNC
ncbi:hypothetical protein [uncultured Psychromonas sp.]|uniref:hypothetical protein n=1 Tax=uncultured Psychromonas sp. TaxID=173974 RepID=UPI00261F9EF1|nr:hypothetical protein [uncultured Psychromonas sp.]